MAASRILIFGGPPYQLRQVTELIVYDWAVSICPPGRMPAKHDIDPPPELALLVPEDPSDENLPTLQIIRKALPGLPVIMIAKDPAKEDIIRAFRLGIKDYLLFPLQADELQLVLNKYRKKEAASSGFSLRGWGARLRNWLRTELPQRDNGLYGMNRKNRPNLKLKDFFLPSTSEMKTPYGVAVQFFGGFRVWVNGRELPLLPGEKTNAFFAFLLYNHQKAIHREILLARFWGYTSPSCARKSLNVAMHKLRSHLGEYIPNIEFLQYYNDSYSLNPGLDILTDVNQFLEHWHRGRAVEASQGAEKALEHYQKAASLYKGDFLNQVHYEDWCEQERDNLKEAYLILLDRLGTYFLQAEAWDMAEKVFKKMLEKDICLENIHRKLILCYYRNGRRDKAIRQYYKCTETLQRELNIEPSLSTKELFLLISQDKGKGISHLLL